MPKFTNVAQALDSLDPQKLAGLDATFLFELSGEGGGQWTVAVADNKINVTEGAAADPTTTFKMTAADFVAMTNGELNPVAAFMQGKIKVEGDMSVAMRLQTLFS